MGLSLNLKSNNPFRNRATSPSPHSATSPPPPFTSSTNRAMSKNPFLDASEVSTSPTKNEQSGGLTAGVFVSLPAREIALPVL